MNVEEIIAQILSTRTDVSRKDLLQKIEAKKAAAGGLLTDETAARLVASEMGVDVIQELLHPREISIGDLVFGLNDVTVTGRVLIAHPMQTYDRKNGTEGKLAHLLIADKTGTLRILLWNDKAEIIQDDKLEQGQIVRILHGYIREARDGQLELHLGQRGELQINPKDAKEDNYPQIESFIEKIGKIAGKQKKANIVGTVQNISQTTVFQRRDGTEGKVLRLTLRDATGQITAVFWNDKVDALNGVKIGDRLQIIDGKVKKRIGDQLELQIENRAHVERLPPKIGKVVKIANLQKEGGPVTVEGNVRTKPMKRLVNTAKGEKVAVTSFEIEDSTGKIWVSAWRKHAETTEQLTVGTKIKIEDAYVRKGFADTLEIATRFPSKIEVLAQ